MEKITQTTLCGLFIAVVASAQPQGWEQVAKITANDAAATDFFGQSVSISGDTAIVGAYLDDDEFIDSGSAYVFERGEGPGNWTQVANVTAEDAAAGDFFGYSVSVSGDTAIVGAYLDDDMGSASGSAYIFERNKGGLNNWGQVAKITADDAAPGDEFGFFVSANGNTVVVGALRENNSGSAYVFERDESDSDNWSQVAKLKANDAAPGDVFGRSVAISGDTAVVGANGDDDAGSASGSAYVFERNSGGTDNWGQVAKLKAEDAMPGDEFGFSVSASGSTTIVGAISDDASSGSAYVFEQDSGGSGNWGQVAKLKAEDAAPGDVFGIRVSLSGDTTIIGAALNDAHGSAYVFERDQGDPDNWVQVDMVTAADVSVNDNFGISVSISGDTAIVGARYDDDAGGNSGSAYVFRLTNPLLTIPTALPASSGDPVAVPVELTTNAHDLASLAFSVDYDAACLDFDPTDNNADGIPDAIHIPLPTTFTAIAFFDLGDTDGEIDIALFANDPTTTNFIDGTLATLTFTSTCSSGPTDPILSPIVFSSDPAPDFGDPDAQDVTGSSADGSVEIFSGIRGDCNANDEVGISDVTALQLESFDGDGIFWADTLNVVPFPGSPVGCDSNADTLIDAGDISCIVRLFFDFTCGSTLRSPSFEGPRLSLPAELNPMNGSVVAPITFEPRGAAINSLMFSLDYDETRLTFDDLPGSVRFHGTPVSQRFLTFNASDTDGELDIVVADLTMAQLLAEGLLVEVDLRLLDPGATTIEDGVIFSAEPPASFGDIEGHSVPGTAEIDRGLQVIFADGFETGDTSAWTVRTP